MNIYNRLGIVRNLPTYKSYKPTYARTLQPTHTVTRSTNDVTHKYS